uniref:Uncharacterized protein n=1 Tax=Cannabis sativa TaxID=3483 RepID=A0A803Q2B0_CANSA
MTVIRGEASLFVDLEELVLGNDGKPTQEAMHSQAKNLDKKLEDRVKATQIFRYATPPSLSPPLEERFVPPSTSYPSTSKTQVPEYSAILARLENIEKDQIALKQG